MKRFFKALAGVSSLFIVFLLTLTLCVQAQLPDNFFVPEGGEFFISSRISITGSGARSAISPVLIDGSGNRYGLNLSLFRRIEARQTQVQAAERKMVVPGGIPFGIKMHTRGVLIVGMSGIQNGTQNLNPAKDAGLKVGDIIISINDININRNSDVARFIADCEGTEVKITIVRGNMEMDFYIMPVKSEYDDCYKAGVWVRDSSAGIGTLTYYDPDTLGFGGLGHAICDVDTGEIMPLFSGEIVDVNISGVNSGFSGKPGELKGIFANDSPLGRLCANSESGIFGILDFPVIDITPVPMALRQEIHPGSAQILSTVSGNKPQSFDIEIEKVNYSDTTPTKNMIIRVIDDELLTLSGGIVQGMSGSPILQDGKLVGAVTHVFVNDPTRGYGIFAENMEKVLTNIEDYSISA